MSSRVAEAIANAQTAVRLDAQGDVDNAIVWYTEAITIISGELPSASAQHQPVLQKYLQTYQLRVQALQSAKEAKSASSAPGTTGATSGSSAAAGVGGARAGAGTGTAAAAAGRGTTGAAAAAATPAADEYTMVAPPTPTRRPRGRSRAESNMDAHALCAAMVPQIGKLFALHEPPFQEDMIGADVPEAPPPPTSQFKRPFWLMSLMAASMDRGGYLCDSLWVPKAVWQGKGVRFVGIKEKVACCMGLVDRLVNLQTLDINNVRIVERDLGDLVQFLNATQKTLSRVLSYIPEVGAPGGGSAGDATQNSSNANQSNGGGNDEDKPAGDATKTEKKGGWMQRMGMALSNKAAKLTASTSKSDDSSYLHLVGVVLRNVEFLSMWLDHFGGTDYADTGHGVVVARIRTAIMFLENVFCVFVMRDVKMLLLRYMKLHKDSLWNGMELEKMKAK